MRTSCLLVVLATLAVAGCKTASQVPRGRFYLPEDSFMTIKRIEKFVPAGMPIEEAREVMELHGFACTFEEVLGIPHLQCTQLKRLCLWPFEGVWMATIYYEHGLVTFVQARFDENPYEQGVRIPKRKAVEAREVDQAKDAHDEMPLAAVPPPMDDMVVPAPPVVPEEVVALPAAEGLPAASVPVEIP
jgi:hypothetical protein